MSSSLRTCGKNLQGDPRKVDRTRRGGEIEDEVYRTVDLKWLNDILAHELKPAMISQVTQVFNAAGDQVVDAYNLVTIR